MIKKLKHHLTNQGKIGASLLLLFPVVLLITNTKRLFVTLWDSRHLSNGEWTKYNRFRPQNAINSLFYWTQALNFDRFGRRGTSRYVGTGNYSLGNWWFSSLTSSYIYWRLGGCILSILSISGWIGGHFIWFDHANVNFYWLTLVLTLAFVSSYFYGAAFVFMNYNAFGWIFMPIAIYGMLVENYWVSSIAMLAASLGSLTVVFIFAWLSLVWAIYQSDFWPLVAMIPAALKLSTHFLFSENLITSVTKVVSSIGLNNIANSDVKYKRDRSSDLLTYSSIYFLLTWGAFTYLLFTHDRTELAILTATIMFLWVFNSSLTRFADSQSLYMGMFSVATAAIILMPNHFLLVNYWLGVSPLPILIGAAADPKNFLWPKSYKPFCIEPLISKAEKFLVNLPENSRVLLALNDPGRDYNKIFDGYRVIYELLFYVGNLKKVLIFPDWWAIFENNKVTSPGFWGREPREVQANLQLWNADYALIYQYSDTELDPKWSKFGFLELSSMDWKSILEDELEGEICWENTSTPKWFLLKAPTYKGSE